MCKESFCGRGYAIHPQDLPQIPLNADLNNSLTISEVAEQLAEIGDKVELSYQEKRRQEDQEGLAIRIVYIAIFIAFRVLIWPQLKLLQGQSARAIARTLKIK